MLLRNCTSALVQESFAATIITMPLSFALNEHLRLLENGANPLNTLLTLFHVFGYISSDIIVTGRISGLARSAGLKCCTDSSIPNPSSPMTHSLLSS